MNIFYFNYTELNQKCSSLRQKQRYVNTTTITHTKTTQFVIMAGRCGPAHGTTCHGKLDLDFRPWFRYWCGRHGREHKGIGLG